MMPNNSDRNIRKINEMNADDSLSEITTDWNKMSCRKCERRYHFCCPKPDYWNKKGEYYV